MRAWQSRDGMIEYLSARQLDGSRRASRSRSPLPTASIRPPTSSLVRKCALQSTSMPALHRRNVPNCRPKVDGGMSKCSAGACPPLGSGWGVAESAVPIRWTKPQLRLFIPRCAGTSRHERLVRKRMVPATEFVIPAIESMPRTPIRGRNPEGKGGTNHTQTLPTTRPHFHTLVCRRQPG